MEGAILLALVPAIVFSLILVLGFSGCSFSVSVGLSSPTNLTAVNVGTTTVTLSWLNPNLPPLSYTFEIERTREGDSAPTLITVSQFPTDAVVVVDTNLEPATNYLYQVKAVEIATDSTSGPSNSVFVTTLP
jgi:hypothetical protein